MAHAGTTRVHLMLLELWHVQPAEIRKQVLFPKRSGCHAAVSTVIYIYICVFFFFRPSFTAWFLTWFSKLTTQPSFRSARTLEQVDPSILE